MIASVGSEDITIDRQFNGFRQVWSQHPNGVFHGPYVVYWESGPMLCMKGQYVDGSQEGLWTYWDRDGRITHQAIFENDAETERRTAPPWLDGMADQR